MTAMTNAVGASPLLGADVQPQPPPAAVVAVALLEDDGGGAGVHAPPLQVPVEHGVPSGTPA